jgi:hypothetical protein
MCGYLVRESERERERERETQKESEEVVRVGVDFRRGIQLIWPADARGRDMEEGEGGKGGENGEGEGGREKREKSEGEGRGGLQCGAPTPPSPLSRPQADALR